MGRRKKEPAEMHRKVIGAAAEKLFTVGSIQGTTMDHIAKAAGYSKATLYVYFKNKDEIVLSLTLMSMEILFEKLSAAISSSKKTRTRYNGLCTALAAYYQEFPLYFQLALDEINIDFKKPHAIQSHNDIFTAGERINEKVCEFIQDGIAEGALRKEIQRAPTIFIFWASLSGLIMTAEKKANYLTKIFGLSKEEFLSYGFDLLYRSIEAPKN